MTNGAAMLLGSSLNISLPYYLSSHYYMATAFFCRKLCQVNLNLKITTEVRNCILNFNWKSLSSPFTWKRDLSACIVSCSDSHSPVVLTLRYSFSELARHDNGTEVESDWRGSRYHGASSSFVIWRFIRQWNDCSLLLRYLSQCRLRPVSWLNRQFCVTRLNEDALT